MKTTTNYTHMNGETTLHMKTLVLVSTGVLQQEIIAII